MPTQSPTLKPTKFPLAINITHYPTTDPTTNPTRSPTKLPSKLPTENPSAAPTKPPSKLPTKNPSTAPTKTPSNSTNKNSTTIDPTVNPINDPTMYPTVNPAIEATFATVNVHINLTISNENITVLEVIKTLNATIIDYLNNNNHYVDLDYIYKEIDNSDKVVINIILSDISTSVDLTTLSNVTQKSLSNEYGTDVKIIYIMVIIAESPKISSTELPQSTQVQDLDIDNDIFSTTDLEAIYQWVFVGILVLTLVLCITGYIHSKKCRINNYFKLKYLISASFQSLDVFSDACFVISVFNLYRVGNYRDYEYMVILLASALCIIVPILTSMGQVFIYSNKYWVKDNLLSAWFIEYNKLLYIFSFITGSSFSALLLLNSHLYSLAVFSMGINERDLLKFSTKRIYSVILMENLPQILIQIYFLYKVTNLDDNLIAVCSLIFSLVSVIITSVSMISQKSIINSQNCTQLSFDVLATEFNGKKSRKKVNELRKYLVNNVLVKFDKKLIEIPIPQQIPSGLSVTINIYTNDQNSGEQEFVEDVVHKSVSNGNLPNFIKSYWNINTIPNINNISTKTIQSKQLQHKLRSEVVTNTNNAIKSTSEQVQRDEGENGSTVELTVKK
eukprot:451920_1